jgi:hypothetical protein
MRKTDLARIAFKFYAEKNIVYLVAYTAAMLAVSWAPLILIAYLYEHVHPSFYLLVFIYAYFGFPLLFAGAIGFFLVANALPRLAGQTFRLKDATFSEFVQGLFGFKIKD